MPHLEGSSASVSNHKIQSAFLVEYALGHRTHTRFLEQYLSNDSRFEASIIRLQDEVAGEFVGKVAGLPGPLLRAVRHYGVGLWAWRIFWHHRSLARRLLPQAGLHSLDLLYIHTQSAAAVVLGMSTRTRVAVSIDLTWKQVFKESRYATAVLLQPVYKLERDIFERSDLILCFSRWAADSVKHDYQVPPEKIRIVRNGIQLPDGSPRSSPNHQFHIGFVGNDFRRKGGDTLLDLHQKTFSSRSHLTIVTKDKVREGGLTNVTVLRRIPWEELMAEVMPTFDVFVFPTQFDYSPYVIIEAMMSGVPVIASKVGAIPEMVRDGVDGFLISSPDDLAARLEWAIDHPEEMSAMGRAARAHAIQEYSAETTYPTLLDLLAELAMQGDKSRSESGTAPL